MEKSSPHTTAPSFLLDIRNRLYPHQKQTNSFRLYDRADFLKTIHEKSFPDWERTSPFQNELNVYEVSFALFVLIALDQGFTHDDLALPNEKPDEVETRFWGYFANYQLTKAKALFALEVWGDGEESPEKDLETIKGCLHDAKQPLSILDETGRSSVQDIEKICHQKIRDSHISHAREAYEDFISAEILYDDETGQPFTLCDYAHKLTVIRKHLAKINADASILVQSTKETAASVEARLQEKCRDLAIHYFPVSPRPRRRAAPYVHPNYDK